MKTFDDLEFKKHHIGLGLHAKLDFDNGYGVSVVFGDSFYSNGKDTYEVAIRFNGEYNGEEPMPYVTIEELNSIMMEVQSYG